MIGHHQRLLVVACLLHGVVPFAGSEPPSPRKAPVRVDSYGDPLPAGALARLGPSRFRGLGGPVELSADGKTLVVASSGVIRVLDTSTDRELRRRACKDFELGAVALSADGKLVATGERFNGKVRLWNVETGQERVLSRSSDVTAFVFSANGKVLAARQKASVEAWETASGNALGPFKVLQTRDVSIALSADGKTLLTYDGREEERGPTKLPQLWDTATGKRRGQVDVVVERGAATTFSADGKILALTTESDIALWDLAA